MQACRLFIRGVVVFCVSLLGGATALAQELPEPRSVPVRFFGPAAADAESRLVGRGVALDGVDTPSLARKAAVLSPCGGGNAEIVWREVRRDTDPEGGTHVVYRQHLTGGGFEAELLGSEIAVHRTRDGTLSGVSGRQFDSVVVSGCTSMSAEDAVSLARERVLTRERVRSAEAWTMPAKHAARLAETNLKLVQVDGVFRPAWFTIADDAEGEPHEVILDADDGRLLALRKAARGGNCLPSSSSYVSAYGVPVRPELNDPNGDGNFSDRKWRGMKASPVTRGAFTHEGVWLPSMPLTGSDPYEPSIRLIVFHGTSDSTYQCVDPYPTVRNYTVFPLKIDPTLLAVPVYENTGSFYGRAAGDALWNMYKTMFAFRDLGRKGWDGANGDARILVHNVKDTLREYENAEWMPTITNKSPAQTVRIPAPQRMYNLAASLDLVAHEFGHGLIIASGRNFPNTPVGNQFHEGWADVIGMLVEKRSQPSGTGLEQSSDWVMHEDVAVSGYARGALDDGTGHDWVGITYTRDDDGGVTNKYTFNDRLHRLDTGDSSSHASGNMLNVAYRIMAVGGSSDLPSGRNPVCVRQPSWPGCEPANAMTSSEYIGAAKAGAVLFRAIQFHVLANTTWDDVADRVMEAAYERYKNCSSNPPYNASAEQNAVRKAFAGIGYPTHFTTNILCH